MPLAVRRAMRELASASRIASAARSAREDDGAGATPSVGNETGRTAAGATMRPAMRCGSGSGLEDGDAELLRLVDEVLGDAAAGV